MARVDIPVTNLVQAGVLQIGPGTTEVTGNNAQGHRFKNDGRVFLHVRNLNAGSAHGIQLVAGDGLKPDGLSPADYTLSIPPLNERLWGPFPPQLYNQVQNAEPEYCWVGASGDVQLRFRAFRIPEGDPLQGGEY